MRRNRESLEYHLHALQQHHTYLSSRVVEETKRPFPDDALIRRLKKLKLLTKDDMARMRRVA